MSDTKRITSLSNPRVKAAMKLRQQRGRRKAGVFLAEGVREIERAIASKLSLRELFVCPELLGEASFEVDGSIVIEVPEAVLAKMTYRDDPEGVLAVVEDPAWSFDDLADGLLLVAVGTEKPGNLGAMVRTAEAAGCVGVIAAGTPVDAFNPNAIRASTGAVMGMAVVAAEEAAALEYLRSTGYRVLAAAPGGDVPHTRADWSGKAAVVIGPEDRGLSEDWLAAADQRVAIPNQGRIVDSLNASTAAAVLLFEALRQRSAS